MANQFKSVWLVILLLTAGIGIFFLTMAQDKAKPQSVVLQDIVSLEKDPVSSPAIVADTDSGKQTGFAIQVYSFQDKNRAQAALEALKASKYDAYLIISDLGEKGTWYRVRIGGLSDEAMAQQTLEQIRKNYNSGFIVKPVINK